MPTTEFDYLIVGQGLAGTILAHNLITQGQRVMVIDNAHTGSSSKVAAGIINPITGPRLKNSDEFELYYSTAHSYYSKLEYHIKETVFRPIHQIKKIQSEEQHSFLKKRLLDTNYNKLIKPLSNDNPYFKPNDLPQISLLKTAVVDTNKLLKASKKWLSGIGSYIECNLEYSELIFSNEKVSYKHLNAQKIIFCEGFQAIHNPLLSHLPFKLAKGEILTLDINKTNLNNTMLSWDKWLIPFQNTAKLGSNFSWDDIELTPDPNIQAMLLQSLHNNININYSVVSHDVGIRPSSRQREPFIGLLPQQKNAYCFNGFGSKGCLLIPFYAKLLTNHLLKQTSLPTKVTQWL